jgi:hypothetical protein
VSLFDASKEELAKQMRICSPHNLRRSGIMYGDGLGPQPTAGPHRQEHNVLSLSLTELIGAFILNKGRAVVAATRIATDRYQTVADGGESGQ